MKILIFYGSYGGGHLSAAKALKNYFDNNYKDVETTMIDCIEYINKYVNKISTKAYKEMAKKAPWIWKKVYNDSQTGALAYISTSSNKIMSHRLNTLIQEEQPDLIISTHPFSTQMCGNLKKLGKINCKIATILTDYAVHNQWFVFSEYMDYFFVAHQEMKLDMINLGIPENKIFDFGIPISTKFLTRKNKKQIFKEFELNPNKHTILYFAGGEFGLGRNTTFMILKAIIRLFKDFQVVAIAGKNKKMEKRFEELVEQTHSSHRIKVLAFTDKVPELMYISDMVITKPGGLTITESLASHLPIIIINPIPGQEEENANFLINNNIAISIRKEDNIARKLKTLYRNLDKIEAMKENSISFSKPQSTKNICTFLHKEIKKLQ